LLSPAFYDSYFSNVLSEADTLLRGERQGVIYERLARDGVDMHHDVFRNLEVFRAFNKKGYTTAALVRADFAGTVPIITDIRYTDVIDSNLTEGWVAVYNDLYELRALLSRTTPWSFFDKRFSEMISTNTGAIPLPQHAEIVEKLTENTLGIGMEKELYRRIYDSFSIKSPKFLYVVNEMAKDPYDRIYETGLLENPHPENPYSARELLLPQWEYTTEVLLIIVDMILEENPDAIIILQADHGPHNLGVQDAMLEEGWTRSEIVELNHSVFSAVRIPQKYGGLDEPLDPRDISRFLVNNFVGENYSKINPNP